MNGEQIHEKGIVLEAKDGKAKVELLITGSCEECTAKIFCKPKDNNSNVLEVSDPYNVKPGDEVTINIEGSDIFKASLKLYGIPLILLVGGILLGINFGVNELFAFLIGAGATAIYYAVTYFIWKRSDNIVTPKIVFVKPR